jgi:hypothetical protein
LGVLLANLVPERKAPSSEFVTVSSNKVLFGHQIRTMSTSALVFSGLSNNLITPRKPDNTPSFISNNPITSSNLTQA